MTFQTADLTSMQFCFAVRNVI
uniref:Uncharacterized protein n=1 Tax=Arundo donax TaxID=35708 RepID=A0A0A8ZC13_ARUDO